MKKMLYLAALAASLLVVPALASAGVIRVEKELGWYQSNATYPNGFVTYDTKPIASEVLDTTGTFSMKDVAIVGSGFPQFKSYSTIGAESTDSLLVAMLYIYRDSTAAGTTNCTALTASFYYSYDGVTWGPTGGAAGTFTAGVSLNSGDPVAVVPFYIHPNAPVRFNIFADKLRIAFTSVTGQLPAARVRLVYWADDSRR